MNNKIRKLQQGDYFQWNNLSREDKVKRNKQIAKQYLDKGPSIQNYYNALKAYFGGFNPKNPYLITGEAPSPGWGKQGVTGLHKLMAKLPETKQTLLAPLAGRSRAAATLKMEDIVKAQQRRDEIYKRWASLYKQEYNPTPTTFRTKPARVKRQETDISKSNGRTLAGGKGNAGGSYSSKSHTIRVTSSNKTSAENLEDIAFHEGIHSYGLGESPSYVWKSKYLNFPEGTNPYFLDPREIATHGIQQGQNLGIKVGQAYPGKEAMIKMIENRPEGQGFGGVPMILYNNAKTNSDYRRLWSLLNGTFKDGGVITTANARKWKHKNGGKAFVNGVNVLDSNPKMSKAASRKVKKADDGTKLNTFQKVGNFLNSDTGKAIGSTLINGLSAGFQAKQMNDAINEYELASKAKLKKILNGVYSKDYYNQALQTMNPDENLSSVVLQKRAYDIGQQEAQKMYNEAKDRLDQQMVGIKQYANEQFQNNFSNVLGGITQLGSLLNNKSASKVDNGTPSTTNFWDTPTIRNSQVTGDFWNNPTIANSIT